MLMSPDKNRRYCCWLKSAKREILKRTEVACLVLGIVGIDIEFYMAN